MFKKKSLITLVSLLAILCVTVGGSLAFLVDTDGPVTNTFNPSKVTTSVEEDIETNPKVKQNVKIKNTGDTDAYIRATVVVTWQDAQGNVYGKQPVAGTDYTISFNTDAQTDPAGKWVKYGGFYYWTETVAPDATTGVLITSCTYTANAPTGYSLAVEIIGSGIQADGEDAKGNKPIWLAWGVDIQNGDVQAASIIE